MTNEENPVKVTTVTEAIHHLRNIAQVFTAKRTAVHDRMLRRVMGVVAWLENHDPRSMTEREITEEVDAIKDRLTVLYAARRGRMIDGPQINAIWGWCAVCGQNLVNAADGFDTCRTCKQLIGGKA